MSTAGWSAAEPYERCMGRWSRALSTAVIAALQPRDGLRWNPPHSSPSTPRPATRRKHAHDSMHRVLTWHSDVLKAFRWSRSGRTKSPPGWYSTSPPSRWPQSTRCAGCSGRGHAPRLTWDYSGGMQMLHRFWMAAIAEAPDAAHLDEGVRFPICRPGQLAACFRAAGLADVHETPITTPTSFASVDDYWVPFLGGQGPAPSYVATLAPDAITRLRTVWRRAFPSAPTDPSTSPRPLWSPPAAATPSDEAR